MFSTGKRGRGRVCERGGLEEEEEEREDRAHLER